MFDEETCKTDLGDSYPMEGLAHDFAMFKSRPEYYLGKPIPGELLISTQEAIKDNITKLMALYDTLIAACVFETVPDEERAVKIINRCLNWLHTATDFYVAPASTKYHENFPGGLLLHSLRVANVMMDLMKASVFGTVNMAHAILVALVHDWCKINFYEPYQKNVKDPNTGQWYQETAYKYAGSEIPLGHGVTSMFIAQKFFNLTTEQALAIRWHMEAYNVCDSEKPDLYDANAKYKLVQLIQMADKLSLIG